MAKKRYECDDNVFVNKDVQITFREFYDYINKIKQLEDFECEIHQLGRGCPNKEEFELRFPTMVCEIVELLEKIMNDTEDHWISYFIFDVDFGRKFKKGDITLNGKEINLYNYKDLWTLLTNRGDKSEI